MSDFKLRIKSKKLTSGKFQVNFSTEGYHDLGNTSGENFYGYLLTEPQTPVREIVQKIARHLEAMRCSDRYYQRNLFSLTHREVSSGRIMIFKTEKSQSQRAA